MFAADIVPIENTNFKILSKLNDTKGSCYIDFSFILKAICICSGNSGEVI